LFSVRQVDVKSWTFHTSIEIQIKQILKQYSFYAGMMNIHFNEFLLKKITK
jgi:hypothetical protein